MIMVDIKILFHTIASVVTACVHELVGQPSYLPCNTKPSSKYTLFPLSVNASDINLRSLYFVMKKKSNKTQHENQNCTATLK